MCHFCYLSKGNKQKATECKHTNRTHHARGLCKICYQRVHYKVVSDPNATTDHIKKIICDADQQQLVPNNSLGKFMGIKEISKKIYKKKPIKTGSNLLIAVNGATS